MILSRIAWTSLGSGACPSNGLMALRTRPMPLMQMKMPTPRPAQPSRSKPVVCEISAATKTEPEVMTSFLESCAVAMSVSESMRSPSVRLNAAIQSLTSMDKTRAAKESTEYAVGEGLMILVTDSRIRLMPTAQTRTATNRPARYS